MRIVENIARAPLVPAAVLTTAGIVLDRCFTLPLPTIGVLVGLGLVLAFIFHRRRGIAACGVTMVVVGLAGLHHQVYRNIFPADDIGFLAGDEPRLVRLHSRLAEEPNVDRPPANDPLRSVPGVVRTRMLFNVEAVSVNDEYQTVAGRVAVTAAGDYSNFRAGDAVEAVGWLHRVRPPANLGERDSQSEYLDHRVRAILVIRGGLESVRALSPSDLPTVDIFLSRLRNWSRARLSEQLPAPLDGTAAALLLGDGSAMTRSEWDQYIRTGVVHVIAVSGQHLAVLAGFAWLVLRTFGVSRQKGAIVVAVGIILYSVLAGGRPPVLRSAVMVVVVCGAIVLRRIASPANSFALAWLIVLLINPTDLADPGCQLSFLCVAVLIWGCRVWFASPPDNPIQQLIEESRPAVVRWFRWCAREVLLDYGITLILGFVILPLTAAHYHLISPVGLLIGPPAILLASIALVAGFLQLVASAIVPVLAPAFAVGTKWSLLGLTALVDAADKLPGSYFYAGTVPIWWLVGFYGLLAVALWWPTLVRRPLVAFGSGVAWTCFGLAVTLYRPLPDGLVMTFLAVGHGGCTVTETPDGRVILYDAGSMSGPDVAKRIIAPFLWHRGIQRIDDIFLSHADLDHFNALPQLLDRFPVGRVNITPSFASKPTPGVHEVLTALHQRNVSTRVVSAGDRFAAGEVAIEVLHPPAHGPPGPENNRSMVLAVRHHGSTVLLTGDLDAEGRGQLLAGPRQLVEVLMAPHHGGKTANPPALGEWCRPAVVIACQGATDRTDTVQNIYESQGCRYVGTWPHGAVTLFSRRGGFECSTFRTKNCWTPNDPSPIQPVRVP